MDKKVGKKVDSITGHYLCGSGDRVFCVSEDAEYTRRTGQSNGRRKRWTALMTCIRQEKKRKQQSR